MSKIDYQKLREIAEKTKIAGEAPVMPFEQRINALNDFMKHFSPDIALALLDELERNQQYIKRRDQENEEIALTVGKLRVELEKAKSKLNEQREYYEGVISDGSKRIAELEKSEEQLINERDHAEAALADMYFAATGDRPEWSNWFGFSDAVDAVVDRIADLEAKQPSPVVPEEKPMPNPLSMYAVDAVAAIAEVRGWNACRAAMLQSQGNCIKDGWISCSERMPKKGQNVLISVNFDSSLVEPLICSARYTGSTFRRGDATIKPGNGIEQATHWMQLPEPPQEVNRG
ncbi:TPA: ead/Ea22-like family protein [Escherichia coli]